MGPDVVLCNINQHAIAEPARPAPNYSGGLFWQFKFCSLCFALTYHRYMQSLSRRGLHRTALEVCKLLLALDHDDPLGALCTIDYLALRAGR